MKQLFTLVVFAGLTLFGVQNADAQVFNNHPQDCPTVGVVTRATATASCWPTSISNVQAGDEIAVGVYFHNNSPIDTSINVRMSDPRGGSGNNVSINGTIEPSSGAGAGGTANISFAQPSRLEYIHTKVYWNGVDNGTGGTVKDSGGRVFSSGEPIGLVPGKCDNCGDEFLYQGVVKVYFKVIAVNTISSSDFCSQINDQNWDTSGYPRVEFPSNTSNNPVVTVKGKNLGGRTVEFYNQSTGRYEAATNGSDTTTWYNVSSWPTVSVDGNSKLYSTWMRYAGCNNKGVQGWFRVTYRDIVQTTYAPSVQTLEPTNIGLDNARLNGNLTSTGGIQTASSFFFGYRSGSTCQASDLRYQTTINPNASTGSYSAYISQLASNTWYCYEAVAVNAQGEARGGIKTFKTSTNDTQTNTIRIETVSAEDVTSYDARLRGEVRETGSRSYVRTWFELDDNYNDVASERGTRYNISGDLYRSDTMYKTVTGLSRGTRYYFRACGDNGAGEKDCGDILNFITTGSNTNIEVDTQNETDVSYNSARLRGIVQETGRSTSLRTWFEYGTSQSTVANGSGIRYYLNDYQGYRQGQSFSQLLTGLSSNTRYYYRACGDNTDNERSCGYVEDFVTLSNGTVTTQGLYPSVTTLAPSTVREYSARLNGSFIARSCSTELWFEYGRTTSLGTIVNIGTRAADDRGVVNASVYDLEPNKTYYYRIVGSNCNGIVRGSLKSFRTPSLITTVIRKPVVKKPVVNVVQVKKDVQVASTSICSPDLDLKIDNARNVILDQEQFDYTISYQNMTPSYVLRDIELQIELPPQVEYVSSTRGVYNKDSHSLFISRSDINPSERQSFTVTVRAKKGLVRGDLIVASATASFVSPTTGLNDSSTDFDSDEYDTGSSSDNLLGGSSTGTKGFLPTSLVGWLSLIFLIFLFIAALRWLWFGKKGNDYNYAYGPYVAPSNGGPVAAPVAQPTPVQPVYVPYNPNQPR